MLQVRSKDAAFLFTSVCCKNLADEITLQLVSSIAKASQSLDRKPFLEVVHSNGSVPDTAEPHMASGLQHFVLALISVAIDFHVR
jgi:hypothetical protein